MRYLHYHGPVTEAGARNVEALAVEAAQAGEPKLCLVISSQGGDVNAGIGLFNFLRMLPIQIETHAAGMCCSIAATIFLAGARRTASLYSVFSLHAASYVDGPKKGQIAPDTDLISKPFRELLQWSDAEIAARFAVDDFRFGPDMARSLGLIHEIDELMPGASDLIVPVAIP